MDEYSNRRRVDICACCGGAVWQNRYWYKENCYCSFLCKINAEQKGVEEMENMEQRMARKLRRKEVFRLVEGHLRHYRMHKRLLMQYRLLGEEGAESVGEPQTPELADRPALYDFWELYEEAAVNCFAPEVRTTIRGALQKLDSEWEKLRL